jgi:hypothetical protein
MMFIKTILALSFAALALAALTPLRQLGYTVEQSQTGTFC